MGDRLQRLLISVILLMVMAESVVGLLQTFDILPSVNNIFKMTGPFKNPGPFGGFVAVGLAIYMLNVGFHCTWREHELLRNRRDRHMVHETAENLFLAL